MRMPSSLLVWIPTPCNGLLLCGHQLRLWYSGPSQCYSIPPPPSTVDVISNLPRLQHLCQSFPLSKMCRHCPHLMLHIGSTPAWTSIWLSSGFTTPIFWLKEPTLWSKRCSNEHTAVGATSHAMCHTIQKLLVWKSSRITWLLTIIPHENALFTLFRDLTPHGGLCICMGTPRPLRLQHPTVGSCPRGCPPLPLGLQTLMASPSSRTHDCLVQPHLTVFR